MKRSITVLTTLLAAAMTLGGCSSGGRDDGYHPVPPEERYCNQIDIDGQWGASANTGTDGQYGIGDPFVLRHDGKYYLYPSTSDPCNGIKVFESDDLVHWEDKGFAVSESEASTHGAYAPEVVYYNGYFYLCQSRGGNGHYIYRSESPTEGFTLFSKTEGLSAENIDYGNLGLGIDGSFYVSDEGKLYLLHTSLSNGLEYTEIPDAENIKPSTLGRTRVLKFSSLNGWTEGPGIFRRSGFEYLTYTGNHVISKGYRVGYSYREKDSDAFTQPQDNITIIDTSDEHNGLGHSSNVTGPDLDSVYTAYHSLVSGRGPQRAYNLDRYFASGGLLTANGVTHRPVAMPDKADFCGYAADLQQLNGIYAIGETNGYFTAEFNFIPSAEQTLLFGGYSLVLRDGQAVLRISDREVARADCFVPVGKLVCVRVENGNGRGYVTINGMRKISYDAVLSAGAVGYATREGVSFTALTDEVFGSSDFEAFKNFPTKFPATHYLKGEYRGFSIASAAEVKGGVRTGEKESTERIGDYFAVSLKKGDWVRYGIDVPEGGGEFLLVAEISSGCSGAKLKISAGGRTLDCTVPKIEADGSTVKVSLGALKLAGGVHGMKVEVTRGAVKLVSLESIAKESGEAELSDYRAFGDVTFSNGVLTVTGESKKPSAALFCNTAVGNFRCEIVFETQTGIASGVGFMVRASDYSFFASQPQQSWRGYYLEFGSPLLSLRRFDYADRGTLETERVTELTGQSHKLVLEADDRSFSAVIDGKITLRARDDHAFFGGGLGIYAGNGTIRIHSMTFEKL